MGHNDVTRALDIYRRRLQGTSVLHPLRRGQLSKRIRALEEAERDILNTGVTGFGSTGAEGSDKNNFTTYDKQVSTAFEMYEGRSNFGAELFGSVVDMRVAFIAGDGASFVSKNKAAKEWAKAFFKANGLDGAGLLDLVTTAELEGRNLLSLTVDTLPPTGLFKDTGKKFVRVDELVWNLLKYTVTEKNRRFVEASYKENDKDKTVKASDSVYLVTGRRYHNNINATPGRLHKVITDFQNFSRAKYDLRSNTHLFGRTTPGFETESREEASAVNKLVTDGEWKIGDVFIGPSKLKLIEPTGSAGKAIESDALLALKLISSASGVPMHWLAWPELMSNRATAENLMEVVHAATVKERMIWEAALTELVQKAAVLAVNGKGEASSIIDPELSVKLSLVSLATVKAYVETYWPLVDEILSRQRFTAGLPGTVDFVEEKEIIATEAKERAERSPMQNGALDEAIKKLQDKGTSAEPPEDDEPEDEE